MTLPACKSDVFIADVKDLGRKGVTVDDITLEYCSRRIPELWPNTVGPISSVRFHRPWDPDWNRPRRLRAIRDIVTYATSNGVKVLLGASIGCKEEHDEENWWWTKDLLRALGPNNVMGIAVGNDMDLYYQLNPKSCAEKVWDKGRFWSEFQKRVDDLDDMGFDDLPVTVVLSQKSVEDGTPFVEKKGQALINTFLKNATQKYNKRFVFTFNIDPYHDPNLQLDLGTNDSCSGALEKALCWDEGCIVPDIMTLIRQRIDAITNGVPGYRFWVGELGWASKNSSSLNSMMQYCPEFSSNSSVETFYRGFLQWDFRLAGAQAPEHIFWTSLRDAPNVGIPEYYGLIPTCETDTCKIFASNITDARDYYGADLWWLPIVLMATVCLICFMTICTTIYVCLMRRWGHIKDEPEYPDVYSEASYQSDASYASSDEG